MTTELTHVDELERALKERSSEEASSHLYFDLEVSRSSFCSRLMVTPTWNLGILWAGRECKPHKLWGFTPAYLPCRFQTPIAKTNDTT